MLSLYEMTKDWENVFEMLLDPEIPEEAIFDTIEMIEADMDVKADGYAKIIKSMDGDAAQIDAEIKRLQDRKASITNRQKMMKQRLADSMKATGRTKFKTALFSFNIQKNGGAQPVELLDEVPAAWLKPGTPDLAKIRDYLAKGNTLPFAALGDRGESLRIR
uniref:Resistance protein n=1 Tax=Siphoviridae sp. ctqED62 TaxID=2826468 RepID=A0A8S5MRH5_9CAUD|nr:MAG TPA: resistance protein [Siphoviridae sp. ctqED62]